LATLLHHHRCTRIVHKALAEVRPQFRLHYRHGVHGVPHWSRVWFHGRHLAESMDVDPAILAWFAYLHDSQRHNDHRDPRHGHRAADFATRLRRSRVITELDDPAFERLCEAMRLHSDGHTEGDPALRACWDADRPDLWRVGIEPDPALLCTAHARKPDVLGRANRMAEASFGFAWKQPKPEPGILRVRQS
jgi:uncharacterized protein